MYIYGAVEGASLFMRNTMNSRERKIDDGGVCLSPSRIV
jgi:hypothetical protein